MNKQFDGLIFVIAVSVLFFLVQYYNLHYGTTRSFIKYGDKITGSMAVEISNPDETIGVFFLPEKSTIAMIIAVASIDKLRNLHENVIDSPISNGMSVKIGKDQQITLGSMSTAEKIVLNIPINLNTSTVSDLMQVPGIGENQAIKIIDYRYKMGKFNAMDDLMLVSGIKEKKFVKLKKYFSLGDAKSND